MNKDAGIWETCLPRVKKPPIDKEMANIVLNRVANILDRLGVDYWLSAGTLLGAYRDNDFIEGDNDIDMEMVGDYTPVLEAIDKIAPRYRNLWLKSTGQRLQAMWLFPNNTLFDLYIFNQEPRGIVSYSLYSDKEIIYTPDFEKTTINFRGREYPCWEPEKYLTYVYGKDWRTPKKEKGRYVTNC